MMKKSVIVITVIILIFAVAFFSAYFILTFPKNNGEFSIDDFAEEIEMFAYQGDKKYEEPTDYKVAGKIGIKAINEEFGEYSKASIVDWMGCDVQYDKENEIYYVRTYHINPLIIEGAYNVIIKSDGTVLAIWGEK